jgi:hypothetical protein
MSKQLRRVIIFGAPLFVGIINIFHPVYFEPTGIYKAIHNNVICRIRLADRHRYGHSHPLCKWGSDQSIDCA